VSTQDKSDPHGMVLVIEDNALFADVVVNMLDELGFSARVVKNVEDGLLIIDGESIKFIVSDVELPGLMSGLALARDLRRNRPELPVILMTGNAGKAAEAERDFILLEKPFGSANLRIAIETVFQ